MYTCQEIRILKKNEKTWKTLTTPWSKCWRFLMKRENQQIVYFTVAKEAINMNININFKKLEKKVQKKGREEASWSLWELDFTITWWPLWIFRHLNMYYIDNKNTNWCMVNLKPNEFECQLISGWISISEWIIEMSKKSVKIVDFYSHFFISPVIIMNVYKIVENIDDFVKMKKSRKTAQPHHGEMLTIFRKIWKMFEIQ